MEPMHQDVLPSAELPMPQPNYAPVNGEHNGVAVSPETDNGAARAIEQAIPDGVGSGSPPAQTSNAVAVGASNGVGIVSPQSTGTLGPVTPLPADDTDLIEKEWVIKAKHIVEQTKNDPYVQNKEVNKIKAEYLKTRYNKELKLSED